MYLVIHVAGASVGKTGDYVELRFDNDKLITERQRKKICATLDDIARWSGYTSMEARRVMKGQFCEWSMEPSFSLSDCSCELAHRFIDYLIEFCFAWDVPFLKRNADILRSDYIDKFLYCCLIYRRCALCGAPADIHHYDAIGMGRDRTAIDDSDFLKIALCRKHHTIAHTLGKISFGEKYHVYGITCKEVMIDNDLEDNRCAQTA